MGDSSNRHRVRHIYKNWTRCWFIILTLVWWVQCTAKWMKQWLFVHCQLYDGWYPAHHWMMQAAPIQSYKICIHCVWTFVLCVLFFLNYKIHMMSHALMSCLHPWCSSWTETRTALTKVHLIHETLHQCIKCFVSSLQGRGDKGCQYEGWFHLFQQQTVQECNN